MNNMQCRRMMAATLLSSAMSVGVAQTLPPPPVSPTPVTTYDDAANRIVSYTHLTASDDIAQPGLDQSFGYDENSRLTSVTTLNASWSIAYDANGNRTSVSLNGSLNAYTTEATSNRLTSITNPARSFAYDNAGNTTSDSANYTATYSLRGQIATLTKAGVTATYSYDADQRRIRKFTSAGASSTVVFVYDQDGQLLGEYDHTGKALKEYVWLGSTPVAVFTPDPANAGNPPLIYYVHADHLDTPRMVMDRNGARRWRWLAEPFGTTASETNPDSIGVFNLNLRFPGQYADSESGLWYNYFRDYDSDLGRYIGSDPIGLAGGINSYVYVDGNPVSGVDPLGLATYQCTRKLNNVPFRFGDLYHQYVCTGNDRSGYDCAGLGPSGNPLDSPGVLEPDYYKPEACQKVNEDDECIEKCIWQEFKRPIPNYSVNLSQGENCQTYARTVVATCEARCRIKKWREFK